MLCYIRILQGWEIYQGVAATPIGVELVLLVSAWAPNKILQGHLTDRCVSPLTPRLSPVKCLLVHHHGLSFKITESLLLTVNEAGLAESGKMVVFLLYSHFKSLLYYEAQLLPSLQSTPIKTWSPCLIVSTPCYNRTSWYVPTCFIFYWNSMFWKKQNMANNRDAAIQAL